MFPDYLNQTPATSDELARAQRTLAGLEAPLLKAVLRAWHVRPCREKMPCLAHYTQLKCQFNLRTAVATYWRLASTQSRVEVHERFLQLLFWRQRDYPIYEWIQGGMEHGIIAEVLQEDFDQWCEQLGKKKCDSALWIVARLIRLDPPASKDEFAYCLEPLDTLSITRLNAAWFHLLTRICRQVKITSTGDQKVLAVHFSQDVGPCAI